MSTKKLDANYITCDICRKEVPQSCIITDKGGSFPKMVAREHKKHGLEICSDCFRRMKLARSNAKAA